jgi:hypothetical protein
MVQVDRAKTSPWTAEHRRNPSLVQVVQVVQGKVDITGDFACNSVLAVLPHSLRKLQKYPFHLDTLDQPFKNNSLARSKHGSWSKHPWTRTGLVQ